MSVKNKAIKSIIELQEHNGQIIHSKEKINELNDRMEEIIQKSA